MLAHASAGPLSCAGCMVSVCGTPVAACSPILLSGLFGVGAYMSCVGTYCSTGAIALCAPVCALIPV